jgi:hypothetical protein
MSKSTRRSLVDVLHGNSRDELARQFDEAEAAGELTTLPKGEYRCLVASGELVESKSGTPGYSLTFAVLDGEHKSRKVWHKLWLTPAALPLTKRDLGKLGVTSLDQLEQPLPTGLVASVKVVVRADDDGTERNRVTSFVVVDRLADPTADDDFAAPPAAENGGAA